MVVKDVQTVSLIGSEENKQLVIEGAQIIGHSERGFYMMDYIDNLLPNYKTSFGNVMSVAKELSDELAYVVSLYNILHLLDFDYDKMFDLVSSKRNLDTFIENATHCKCTLSGLLSLITKDVHFVHRDECVIIDDVETCMYVNVEDRLLGIDLEDFNLQQDSSKGSVTETVTGDLLYMLFIVSVCVYACVCDEPYYIINIDKGCLIDSINKAVRM